MAKISPGTMTAAIFAILLGLGAAYTVRQFLHKQPGPALLAEDPVQPRQISIPIASRDLLPGQTLSLDDISIYRTSPEKIDKQFNSQGKQRIMATQYITGRVLKSGIKAGQPFHTIDLFPNGMGPGLSDVLEPGNRAVTVAIHKIGNVAGFSRPGAIVDVLFRSNATDGIPETTITLLEKVRVLAVGEIAVPGHKTVGNARNQAEDYSITLEVSPEQGKVLKVVEDHGVLSLALRNPNENTEVVSAGRSSDRLTLSNILGFLPNQSVSSIDIYRAGSLNTVHFKGNRAHKNQNWIDAIETPIASEVLPSNKATTTMKQTDRKTSEISTPVSGL